MIMGPIVRSFLDQDLYKLSMQLAVISKFPDTKVRYTFIDRNNIQYPDNFYYKVQCAINEMRELAITQDEINFLQNIKYLPHWYVNFLRSYRYDPNEIKVSVDEKNHLKIEIEGYWYRTILWEVPILAIISELYYEEMNQLPTYYFENDVDKLRKMESHNVYFADFGTRRRYSYGNQRRILQIFKNFANHCFVGTSNVHLAERLSIKPIGTMAHEWIMAHGAIYGYKMANKLSLEHWTDVYHGNLGIALTDTFTTDVFLKSFDMKLAKLFDGVRQDSGDPYEFTDKIVAYYKKLGIDPMSKTIVFSDSLDIFKAWNIKEYCVGKIKSSFGIGTHLTNDVGVTPLNIVIKLSEVLINDIWSPTIKLSDSKGKHTGDSNEIKLCKKILNIE